MDKQQRKALLLAATFILCGLGTVFAQDSTRVIGLDEAVDLSVANSKILKASRARIDQATAQYTEARQNQLPDLKITGSYLRLTQPNIDLKADLGNNNNTTGDKPQEIKVNQASYGIANLTLPIYSGGRIQYGIRSADFLRKAAEMDAGSDRDAVILNTVNAYTNLYKADANRKLIRENLAQSQSRDRDFANLEKNGLLARNDLLKASLQTSQIELTLVDAESNYSVAAVNMNLLLGLAERTKLQPDSTALDQVPQLKSIEEYEQQAVQNRQDMQALGLRHKASEFDVKSVRSEYYPSLVFTGGYIAADIPHLITITNAVTFGVGVSYSASSLWKTNAKIQRAKARQAELLAGEEQMNDDIRMQINQAYQQYTSAEKKIEVSQKAIDQGEENYKITKNKYDNTLVTVTDLLDANVALLQAKIDLRIARADAVASYNMLLQKAGLIAESHKTTTK